MCGGGSTEKFVKSITSDDGLNFISQMATGGAVGYKNSSFGTGKFQAEFDDVEEGSKLDFGTLPGQSLVKEISGAKAAEEANEDARVRFEEEKALALQAREDAKAQTAAGQIAASRQASSVRGGTSATGSRFSDLTGDERDFLGL